MNTTVSRGLGAGLIVLRSLLIAAMILPGITGCRDSSKQGGSNESSPSSPLFIEPGVGVGKVRVGMTADEVIAQIGQPERKQGGGLEYLRDGFAVGFDKEGRVRVILCGDSSGLQGPLVKAFTGRTKGGNGMHSSRAELVKAYGEPTEQERPLPGREVLKYRSLGLAFTLQDGKVHHIVVDLRVRPETGQGNASSPSRKQ